MKHSELNSSNFYDVLKTLTANTKFVVAYSGGVDSQVLLHLLYEIKLLHPEIEITAIHIDHGLSVNANLWSDHCIKYCENLNIPCITKKVEIKAKLTNKHSKEALARDLRYEALFELLPSNSVLLTAHHANDQAETLLLQLFRGAGPKGLASIAAKTLLVKNTELIRPLLNFSRDEIVAYAKTNNLEWIEDESNLDVNIDRNYVRLDLFPLITKRWRGAIKTLGRAAYNCREASELLDELARQDLENVSGSAAFTLSITKLIALNEARQRNVIRYWLRELNLTIPSSSKLIEIQKTALHCTADRMPLIKWHGTEIRRFQDELYAMAPLTTHDPKQVILWNLKAPLNLPSNLGVLTVAGDTSKIDESKITVRFRQGGEKLKIMGRGEHYHQLKNLFQEWHVPPWQRNRIPLIYSGDELICVVGYAQNIAGSLLFLISIMS